MKNELTLAIGGMHCATCAQTLQRALSKTGGITDARVNFASEQAVVIVDTEVVSQEKLAAIVRSSGFTLLGSSESGTPVILKNSTKNTPVELYKMVVGFTAGFILMFFGMNLEAVSKWLPAAIAIPVFLYTGAAIFSAAYAGLKQKTLTMDVMYALGISSSLGASLLNTLGILPSHDFMFYDTALLLAAFLTMGRYLESRARRRSSSALRSLLNLRPAQATILLNNVETIVPADQVIPGNIVRVMPGDKMPVDGKVTEGTGYVDESLISGESLPILKTVGDTIIGGTINGSSTLTFLATRTGNETLLAQIITLVQHAQNAKLPIQSLADRAVSWFIPIILLLSLAGFAFWFFAAHTTFLFAFSIAVSILVIACPCALGLATPTAVATGIGRGAELGILFKNGSAIELLERCTTVIFDKTGTLTEGTPRVTDCLPVGVSEQHLVSYAASIEQHSRHPLAQAVLTYAQLNNYPLLPCSSSNALEGKGISAVIDSVVVFAGSKTLCNEQGIAIDAQTEAAAEALAMQAKTLLFIAVQGTCIGVIACADALRASSKQSVEYLKKMNVACMMITGDNEHTAQAIARQAEISRVVANTLPEQKAREIQTLQQHGQRVIFVGDGINDAVALAQADVGIAMGSGTDVAVETGDVVLMRNNMTDIPAAIQLGKRIMKQIRLNLFWAFAYNALLVPCAAGIFYPATHQLVKPEWAGMAMAISSVTVVTLSLLLKRYTPLARL
jgi:P-type Cu+ transporter